MGVTKSKNWFGMESGIRFGIRFEIMCLIQSWVRSGIQREKHIARSTGWQNERLSFRMPVAAPALLEFQLVYVVLQT